MEVAPNEVATTIVPARPLTDRRRLGQHAERTGKIRLRTAWLSQLQNAVGLLRRSVRLPRHPGMEEAIRVRYAFGNSLPRPPLKDFVPKRIGLGHRVSMINAISFELRLKRLP